MASLLTIDEEPPFRCPVCGNNWNKSPHAAELNGGQELLIRSCEGCGLFVTWPRLSEPQATYFSGSYESWYHKYGAIDRGEVLHDRHLNYLQESSVVRRYVHTGKLLDVGCNAGWLLGYLNKEATYDLEGLEPSPILADIAARRLRITIHNCYLHELEVDANTFDGIIATDVIEHVPPENAEEFARSIQRLLKPDGYCFIKTPNVGFTRIKSRLISQIPSALRSRLIMASDTWDAKEHLIHWDTSNLVRLLHMCGLEIVEQFVPKPVQTRGSPIAARMLRKAIYLTAIGFGGNHNVPIFAQDIFVVAKNRSS